MDMRCTQRLVIVIDHSWILQTVPDSSLLTWVDGIDPCDHPYLPYLFVELDTLQDTTHLKPGFVAGLHEPLRQAVGHIQGLVVWNAGNTLSPQQSHPRTSHNWSQLPE